MQTEPSETVALLMGAGHEIEGLRRALEIANAKVWGVETMGVALTAKVELKQQPMGVDIVWQINRRISELREMEEKRYAADFAKNMPEAFETPQDLLTDIARRIKETLPQESMRMITRQELEMWLSHHHKQSNTRLSARRKQTAYRKRLKSVATG